MFGFRKGKDRTKALEALANAPVGAASTVDGKRGVIKGTLLLSEAGDRWIEHLISDIDGALYWLAIENFDRTRATRWDSLEVWDVSGGPDDRQVIHDGATYRRNESGTVAFTSKGDTDMFETGTIDYVDFVGPNGVRIGFERYGEEGAARRSRATGGTCPNCHAPLVTDATGRCSSCGAALTADEGWWGSWEVALGRDVTDSAGLQ